MWIPGLKRVKGCLSKKTPRSRCLILKNCVPRFKILKTLLLTLVNLSFLNTVIQNIFSKAASQMIANVMENSGLQTYHQNFTVHMPFAGIMEPHSSMGVNIYGILRAPRIAGTEAVVISVPYDQGNNKGALALMLAFADHCRSKFKISLYLSWLHTALNLHRTNKF